MGRKRNVLHSSDRHHNRNYKRRIRNLCVEFFIIVFLICVAIKSLRNDDEKPTITKVLTEEAQQQIINREMSETTTHIGDVYDLEVLESESNKIKVLSANMYYDSSTNQTIFGLEVKNNTDEYIESINPIVSIINSDGRKINKFEIEIDNLDAGKTTRISKPVSGDYSNISGIKVIE